MVREMIIEGQITQRIVSSNFDDFVADCRKAKEDGFYLQKATQKRQWPYFWIVKYKAKFIKPFVSDGVDAAFVEPLKDLLNG